MESQDLLGEWKFVGSRMTDINDQPLDDPGNKGSGLLIYTATGYMAVQLSSPPADASKNEVAINTLYAGYYGKYYFDPTTQEVTHEVINSNVAALIGVSLKRRLTRHESGLISLKLITPEMLITDQPIYRELFWQLVSV